MKLELEHKFAKTVAKVWAMYSDRAFFERKLKQLGYSNISITDYTTSAKGFSITMRYDAQSDAKLPDFVKKLIGDTSSITETDSWDAATKTGKISIDIKGAPIKVSAEMKLESAGKGSINKINWTLSSGIPLLGGKLERFLAEDVEVKSNKDNLVSAKILEDY